MEERPQRILHLRIYLSKRFGVLFLALLFFVPYFAAPLSCARVRVCVRVCTHTHKRNDRYFIYYIIYISETRYNYIKAKKENQRTKESKRKERNKKASKGKQKGKGNSNTKDKKKNDKESNYQRRKDKKRERNKNTQDKKQKKRNAKHKDDKQKKRAKV